MFNVGEYLKKFSLYQTKNEEAVGLFKKIVKEKGIDLSDTKVYYKDKKFFVDSSNTVKNAMFIKKEALLKEVVQKGVVATDII